MNSNTNGNGQNFGGPAILVIDDDDGIRSLLQGILQADGYDVLLAEDGPRAIEVFRNHGRVALLVLDWKMPGMNGDEVFDAVSAIRPDVKVIVSSGHSFQEIVRVFAGRKVARFLPKPFTSQTLTDTIRSVLAS